MLKQLAGQTAIYGLGTIVPRFLNYLLFPYLTRLMTTGEYGVVTDLYALIPFALVVLTLGLETGYFRFAGQTDSPTQRREIFRTLWGTVSGVALLFLGMVWLFTPELSRTLEYVDHPSYIRMVGVIVALDAITALPFARLRQEGRAMRFMSLRILSVVINLVLTLFFYSLLPLLSQHGADLGLYDPTFGAGYVLVANIVASAAMLGMLLPSRKELLPQIRWRLLGTILLYSFPLLLSGIAGTANEFIDRQMIKYLLPHDEAMDALGVYGAVAKLGVILI
ncbi:MAG: oligosaccharide flippase family protein, partial [Alistipes sp.]|nr:oligosaccharide flippase family protein [Alistipes sp.]